MRTQRRARQWTGGQAAKEEVSFGLEITHGQQAVGEIEKPKLTCFSLTIKKKLRLGTGQSRLSELSCAAPWPVYLDAVPWRYLMLILRLLLLLHTLLTGDNTICVYPCCPCASKTLARDLLLLLVHFSQQSLPLFFSLFLSFFSNCSPKSTNSSRNALPI